MTLKKPVMSKAREAMIICWIRQDTPIMSMKGKRTKSIGNALKNPSHSVELELSLVTILSFRGLENIAMPLLADFPTSFKKLLVTICKIH